MSSTTATANPTSTSSYTDTRLLINGEWCDAASGRTIDVVNPSTGKVIGKVAHAGTADLDRALAAAQKGFEAWRRIPAPERATTMRKAASLVRERAADIGRLLTQEQGKPFVEARGEVLAAADILEWFADEGRRVYGRIVPSRSITVQQLVMKEPVGPVAAFTPWNFPVNQIVRKIGAALASGCSFLVKAPEETPASPAAFLQCFIDAGVPAGTIGLVFGDPAEISEYLIPHPIIRKVTFTGSTPVGKQLAALAGTHLRPDAADARRQRALPAVRRRASRTATTSTRAPPTWPTCTTSDSYWSGYRKYFVGAFPGLVLGFFAVPVEQMALTTAASLAVFATLTHVLQDERAHDHDALRRRRVQHLLLVRRRRRARAAHLGAPRRRHRARRHLARPHARARSSRSSRRPPPAAAAAAARRAGRPHRALPALSAVGPAGHVPPDNKRVAPKPGQSLLEIAEANDLPIEAGCRMGICGADPVAIKDGMECTVADRRRRAGDARAPRLRGEHADGVLREGRPARSPSRSRRSKASARASPRSTTSATTRRSSASS